MEAEGESHERPSEWDGKKELRVKSAIFPFDGSLPHSITVTATPHLQTFGFRFAEGRLRIDMDR